MAAKTEPSKGVTGGRTKTTNKTSADVNEKNNDLDESRYYPSRTLRIFLKEMRIAWENKEDRDQIPKILNDLEHIASKLDLDSSRSGSATGGGSRNDQLLGMEFKKKDNLWKNHLYDLLLAWCAHKWDFHWISWYVLSK